MRKITPEGLLAGLAGNFATTALDVRVTPGALLTGNHLPVMPPAGMEDAVIAMSGDALNQMFASMTMGGALKTSCLEPDTPLTVGDLLQGSCEDMVSESGLAATALLQGACHGIKLDNCEVLAAPAGTPAGHVDHLTAIKQGATGPGGTTAARSQRRRGSR